MIILRLILGFGIGFCLGHASRIGAEVKRRAVWSDQDAQECFAYLFMAFIGAAVFVLSFFVQ